MKNIFKIVRKELDKIFKFPRTIFSTIILPGLILFVIYSIIGNLVSTEINKTEEHISIVHLINAPESLSFATESASELKIEFIESSLDNLSELQEEIKEGTVDAIVVYDENFDELISGKSEVPNVKVYYNSTENNSFTAYSKLYNLIEIQKANLLASLDIDPNIFIISPEELFDEKKAAGTFLAMLLPVLLVTFVFAGAMSIGSDAIAGEKERGTLATLLMAPLKRDEIILGKIVSTTIINICYAGSSFIGIIAALPFMKSLIDVEGAGISYNIIDYLSLFGIIIILSVFASAILLVTSTIAKTVKEATMYAMPIYMIVLLLPMLTMFSQNKTETLWLYIIPVYNCILGIKGVLSADINLLSYLLIIGSMIIYISLLVILLIRLFKQERVLFSK